MSNRQRLAAYDGLKGFAIIMIVLYHLFPDKVPGGFLTVNTFFALSGFFMAFKVEKIPQNNQVAESKQFLAYLRSTFQRLFFPLFWCIGLILIGFLVISPERLRYIRAEVFSSLFLYNNLYQIMADRSYFVQMNEASPFTHFWYNSLYFQSFLIAWICAYLSNWLKLKPAYKALIWAVIAFASHLLLLSYYQPGQDPSRVYYGLETRISSFAVGMMVAYMMPSILNQLYGLRHKRGLFQLIGLVSLLGLVSLPFFVADQSPETYYFLMPLYSVLSMGMIFSIAVGVPGIRWLLSFPPMVFFGQRSYSYYLWYYPVIVFWIGLKNQIGPHWYYLAIILSLCGLAEATYQLIERRRLVIPFLTTFEWRTDWKNFKRHNRSLWLILPGLMMVGATGYSLYISRNDTPLMQFVFQHRELQNKPNIQPYQAPAEIFIEDVSQQVQAIDQDFDVYFARAVLTEDYIKKVQDARQQNLAQVAEIANLIASNQDIFEQIQANDPDLAALVPAPVQIFAADLEVSFFGDSLILLSGNHAKNLFLNATVLGITSLQVWQGVEELRDWIETGQVYDQLVVNLGTNAGLDKQGLDDLIAVAGDRQIYLVNTNSDVEHKDSVNAFIKEAAAQYENVYELDWYSYSQGHPEYYWEGEGIHHSFEGEDHFAAFVAQQLYQIIGPQ
ncbi:TPA: acyltransferase family protein [Streptococcus suis]